MKIMRQQRLQNELEQLKNLSLVEIRPCIHEGLARNDVWILWIPGKEHTIWEKGIYPVTITFPEKYPMEAPRVEFEKQFLHVHVYTGGNVCMPLLEGEYWKPKTTMRDIITRISNLIHQEINVYSPANQQLFKTYIENAEQYKQIILQQANRYSTQNIAYFQRPCIHLKLILEDQE